MDTGKKLTEKQISELLVVDTKPRLLGCTNCVCLGLAAISLLLAATSVWGSLEVANINMMSLDTDGIVLVNDPADPGQDVTYSWSTAVDVFCALPGKKNRQICSRTEDAKSAMGAGKPILIIAAVLLFIAGFVQAAVYGFPCSCTKHGGARRVADQCGVTLAAVMTIASLGAGIAMWSDSVTWANDAGRDMVPDDPDNLVSGHMGVAGVFLILATFFALFGVAAASYNSHHISNMDTRVRQGAVEKRNPISRA